MSSPRNRLRRRPLLWAVAAVLLCGIGGVGNWWMSSAPPTTYQRFVSPPLPDGTRYTFLYPAWMKYANWSFQGDITFSELSTQQQIALYQPTLVAQFNKPSLKATLWAQASKLPFFPKPDPHLESYVAAVARPLKVYTGPDEKKERSVERESGQLFHSLQIVDSHTKTKFFFSHNGSIQRRGRFEEVDAVIIRSFRILPPAAPIPSS